MSGGGGLDEEGGRLDNDSLSILSVCYSNKKIGVAHFSEVHSTIQTECVQVSIEDIAEVLENIKIDLNPTLLLLHPTIVQNTPFLNLLIAKNTAAAAGNDGEEGGNEAAADVYRYLSLKTSCWNVNNTMPLICSSLAVGGTNDTTTTLDQKTNYLKITSLIDLENSHILQSLGALVSYLHTNAVSLDKGLIKIAKLAVMKQQKYLQMDTSTFRSLQIFADEVHPNVIKGGKAKEGFSLFSLIDRTRSLAGRDKLKEWLCRPFSDLHRIVDRQDGVAMAVRTKNIDFISTLCKHLRHVHSIPKGLLKIKKAQASHFDWVKLVKTLEAGLQIVQALSVFISSDERDTADRRFVDSLLSGYDPSSSLHLYQRLLRLIDLEASLAEKKLVIQEGYDRHLDSLRRVFRGLESLLTAAAHGVLEELPLLQSVSVEYVPQVGFVVAVSADQTHFVEPYVGNSDPHSFSFIYSQGKTSFYKHRIVTEMDSSIGDIKSLISDRQKLLLLDVEEYTLDSESELQRLANVLETLDATLSLGAIAQEQDWIRPQVVAENILVIKGGKHPIASLGGEGFVPNDTFITDEKYMSIITGPNSSGKSVYLKQVGLLTFLAHVGSFIPCERAIIGITDKILTRISAVESVSTPSSSFGLDLAQLAKTISSYTERSLCLIDEFGKGTTPLDGISLLGAVIRRFATHRTKSMFVLHFTEILQCKGILDVAAFSCITTLCMEVMGQPTRQQSDDPLAGESDAEMPDEEEAVPLYKLRLGIAASSEGLQCARAAGVSKWVLDRAADVKRAIERREQLPLASMKSATALQQKESRALLLKFMEQDQWAQASEEEVASLRAMLPA